MDIIARIEAFLAGQPPALLWGLGGIGGLLVLGSVVAAVLTPPGRARTTASCASGCRAGG